MKYYPQVMIASLLLGSSLIYAAPPVTLSEPAPSISSVYHAGDRGTSYTYTITNHTAQVIPVVEDVIGNSPSVAVSTPCSVLPANGSCSFIVTIIPTVSDFILGHISDTVTVEYNGRTPSKLTSTFNTTVALPPLVSSINITASTDTTLAGGHVTFVASVLGSNGAMLDLTPVVTWASSNPAVASAPNAQGQATTWAPGGSTAISATYNIIASNTVYLTVNNSLYVIKYTGGTPAPNVPTGFYSIASPDPSGSETITNPSQGISYIAENPDATMAYLAAGLSYNNGSTYNYKTVYACPVNFTSTPSGTYGSCKQYYLADAIVYTVKVSPDGRFLYALGNSQPYVCPIDTTFGGIGSCSLQKNGTNSIYASAFAIDPNGNYMYLFSTPSSTGATTVQSCAINKQTGNLSTCSTALNVSAQFNQNINDATAVTVGTSTYLFAPSWITASSTTPANTTPAPVVCITGTPYTYGNVLVCSVNSNTGEISPCNPLQVDKNTSLNMCSPWSVSVSSTNTGVLELYEADRNLGYIHNCAITNNYTTLSDCVQTNTGYANFAILAR